MLMLPVLMLLASIEAHGQQRLRYTADKQEGRRVNKERVDYLIGNVVIRQEETTIRADSALVQKKERRAEAFGRIRVQEGDSIDITSKRLVYDGSTGTAYMYQDVVYRDGSTILYTDNLEFNKFTGISSYHSGGRMIDNGNTLTSQRGIFDKPNQKASFFGKVVLRSPDATVYSDTLYYDTRTGQARFQGFTRVEKSDGTVTEGREAITYNTQSENAAVIQGFIENQDYIITGDRLRYDRQRELFSAEGNVKMTAKDQQVIILGTEAFYDKRAGITKVYGRPVMKRPVQNDTLFLSADTMMAIESQVAAQKRLLAWGAVRIFKEDIQGLADSLAYQMADSTLFFYRDPILWNEANQMTGDTISMHIRNNQVERMRLLQNGYVISKDTILTKYNQVKGRLITAFFANDELQQIAVNGNGESIYFVLDEKNQNVLMGMNRLTCSNMLLSFGERTIQQIRFYQQPDAVFVPPHELQEPETRLPGFRWLEEFRPSKEKVLSRLPSTAEERTRTATMKGAPAGATVGTAPLKAGQPAPDQPVTKPVAPASKEATPAQNQPQGTKPAQKPQTSGGSRSEGLKSETGTSSTFNKEDR